jgi:hypothetical protein
VAGDEKVEVEELTFEKALSLARQLKAIPGFSWDEDVILAHADHLVRWCKGALMEDGRILPPEVQAVQLVTLAQERWKKWMGPGALLELFRAKLVPVPPPSNAYHGLGEKPPIDCRSCNDFGVVKTRRGYRYCDCDQGVRMAGDPELGDRWIQLHNASTIADLTRRAKSVSAEVGEARFSQHRDFCTEMIADAEAMLADPGAGSFVTHLETKTDSA